MKKKILVTGSAGFLGYNFISKLKEMKQYEVYEYCSFSTDKDLRRFCKDCDYVFHFAGVIKAKEEKTYVEGNVNLTKKLLSYLRKNNNKAPVIFTSSTWVDREPNHGYSRTKSQAEELVKRHATKLKTDCFIYRMNNMFGPFSQPGYGGVVMTFAYNIIHGIPLTVSNENNKVSLTYADDIIEDFVKIIEGKKKSNNFYCESPQVDTVTLKEIIEIFTQINKNPFDTKSLDTAFKKKMYQTFMYYYNNFNSPDLKKITIIFNTCEKYRDTWQPFFKLFKKYGDGLTKCNIIFNSEKTIFEDKDLKITSTASVKNMEGRPWGERLKLALSLAKTDYVFFLMEDYYLRKYVDCSEFFKCLNYLEKNKDIGMFNFESLMNLENEDENFPNYCLIPVNHQYRLNAQSALWRKEVLDKSILSEESPWDWEIYGNQRNAVLLKDIKFYCLKYGTKEPYYTDYYEKRTDWQGYHINRNGVMKGKWYVDFVDPLFRANDIAVDYSNLGEYKPKYYKFSWPWHFLGKLTRGIRKSKLFNKNNYNEKQNKYKKLVESYILNENKCK